MNIESIIGFKSIPEVGWTLEFPKSFFEKSKKQKVYY